MFLQVMVPKTTHLQTSSTAIMLLFSNYSNKSYISTNNLQEDFQAASDFLCKFWQQTIVDIKPGTSQVLGEEIGVVLREVTVVAGIVVMAVDMV